MSMPTFPECGIDITQEQAFNLLLGSIAMEELALSHILNAEGEKLQYILGTLPGKCSPHATAQEVLEVNRSITNLLENVAHNQILLKSKLAQVLEAKEKWNPPPCPAPCPPVPPEPCPAPCPPVPPCPAVKALLYAGCAGRWRAGCRLPWKPCCICGANECCVPSPLIDIPAHRACTVHFTFALLCEDAQEIMLELRTLRGHTEETLLTCTARAVGETAYLSGSTVLMPAACSGASAPLMFVMRAPKAVTVRQASLAVAEFI